MVESGVVHVRVRVYVFVLKTISYGSAVDGLTMVMRTPLPFLPSTTLIRSLTHKPIPIHIHTRSSTWINVETSIVIVRLCCFYAKELLKWAGFGSLSI